MLAATKAWRQGWWLLPGLLLLAIPPFIDSYFVHLLIMILFWGYLGACWNVLGGYAGLFSFGHALFFGVGGYTSTVLYMQTGLSPWVGMLLGGILAAGLGLFVGFLSFRYGLRGIYFGLVTLAFAEICRLLFLAWPLVGGSVGIYIPLRGDDGVAFQFSSRLSYYYVMVGLVVLVLAFTEWMRRHKLGYYLLAIREEEDAAAAVGINTFRYKQMAMAVSAFLTALGGTFYAQYFQYIDPNLLFGVQVTVELLLRPILGGAGTVLGPLLGSAVLGPLAEISRTSLASYQGVYLMVYGVILVVVMVYLPNGIVGLVQSWRHRRRSS
ncbi:MAG: branched-chain amino acid ABC transporter permease [Chloroflexi bacterium]|nr:branched-chain amino acid ABC transporter permease [Chloroflexota bacterium]